MVAKERKKLLNRTSKLATTVNTTIRHWPKENLSPTRDKIEGKKKKKEQQDNRATCPGADPDPAERDQRC